MICHADPWPAPLECHRRRLPGSQLFRLERDQRGRPPATHQLATRSAEYVVHAVLHCNGVKWSGSHLRPQGSEMNSRKRTTSVSLICLMVILLTQSILLQLIESNRSHQ